MKLLSRLLAGIRALRVFALVAVWPAAAQVNLNLGDLADGQSVTITFEVTINDPLPGGVTEISAQGTVSGDNFATLNTDDPETRALQDPTLTSLAADYVVTTTGNALVVSDLAGHADTLNVSEPAGAGTIKFAAPDRTFSVDGGPATADSGTLSLAGMNSVTVNAGVGADTINVAAFAGALPSLTLNGGTGDDTVNFNGDLTFIAGASLDVDLQNDDATPGVDAVGLAASANLVTSGTGTITVRCSRNVLLNPGSSLETVDGNLTVEANQQASPTAGNFSGVWVNNGRLQATGAGVVTVKGQGGDDSAGEQVGVQVSGGGDILGGASGHLSVEGTGGASTGNSNQGVRVADAGTTITSDGGDVQITGAGGGSGAPSGANGGVLVYFGGFLGAGGSGTLTIHGTGGAGSLNAAVSVGAPIASSGGNVQVTGVESAGNIAIGVYDTATISTVGGGAITLIGNSLRLFPSVAISANPSSSVTLRQRSHGVAIDLGSTGDPSGGPLSLSDEELDLITAGTLIIGDANSGALTVSAPSSPANVGALVFASGGAIGDTSASGPDVTIANLTTSGNLSPGASPGIFSVVGNHTLAAGSAFTVEIEGTTVGTQYDQLDVTGAVDLGGATLALGGAYIPIAGDTFIIVNNDGVDPITGTFAGLIEGATVPFNGVNLRISYVGGDGNNDVALTAPLPTAARLAYFRATSVGAAGGVSLTWGTLVEVGTLGFQVERAIAAGGWERVTPQIIPATGWNQRAQDYAVTDPAPAGTTGARYRLIEVDLRGQRSVLAEAAAPAGAVTRIERTAEGLRLNLAGSPRATLVIETSPDLARGPWVEAAAVDLDGSGAGSVMLEISDVEPARFYRWQPR